jgi:hypothetical protein
MVLTIFAKKRLFGSQPRGRAGASQHREEGVQKALDSS